MSEAPSSPPPGFQEELDPEAVAAAISKLLAEGGDRARSRGSRSVPLKRVKPLFQAGCVLLQLVHTDKKRGDSGVDGSAAVSQEVTHSTRRLEVLIDLDQMQRVEWHKIAVVVHSQLLTLRGLVTRHVRASELLTAGLGRNVRQVPDTGSSPAASVGDLSPLIDAVDVLRAEEKQLRADMFAEPSHGRESGAFLVGAHWGVCHALAVLGDIIDGIDAADG